LLASYALLKIVNQTISLFDGLHVALEM